MTYIEEQLAVMERTTYVLGEYRATWLLDGEPKPRCEFCDRFDERIAQKLQRPDWITALNAHGIAQFHCGVEWYRWSAKNRREGISPADHDRVRTEHFQIIDFWKDRVQEVSKAYCDQTLMNYWRDVVPTWRTLVWRKA